MAIHSGADEIDIVISVGKFLSGDYEGMCDEIEELKEVCGDKHLKVILETAHWEVLQISRKLLSYLCIQVLTLSRLLPEKKVRCYTEAAYVMCQAIKEYFLETDVK